MSFSARPNRSAGAPGLHPLELWGGVECTINRVGARFYDQCVLSGHTHRLEDFERIAALGIRTLRFPILWEAVAPVALTECDWRLTDLRMAKLRELGLKPIAGLVHHGSGPAYTDLLDPAFPALLARFAGEVARRYPDIEDWTPINEPLTTARFSGLYGHWYPHGRDPGTFAATLLNQVRGIGAAMKAIRHEIPGARLIQTEDLGETGCTPGLEYQADFENERRWLSFDLLSGGVALEDARSNYLQQAGVAPDELRFFEDHPCPPDLLGINHYVTSSRFLDGAIEQYPPERWGSNGIESYVDEAAVRIAPSGLPPLSGLLRAAWERYGRPLAVTEAHLGCTREEQMRWLAEAWKSAEEARRFGVPVRAVTAWALFGAFNWDGLLTRETGHYEPGAFDVRSDPPRPTALSGLIRELAKHGTPLNPLARQPGWWSRDVRRLSQVARLRSSAAWVPSTAAGAPLLIAGGTTSLGRAVARLATLRGLHFRVLPPFQTDFCPERAWRRALVAHQPWAVINAGGLRISEEAAADPELCRRENISAAQTLAQICGELGVPLLTFSSDHVFGGGKSEPYLESDFIDPVDLLGESFARAESSVQEQHPGALIVRTGPLFGPWDETPLIADLLHCLAQGCPVQAPENVFVSPTYLPDAVHASLDLLIDGEQGIWHVANEGQVSWYEWACRTALAGGLETALLSGSIEESALATGRRSCSRALASARGQLLPAWPETLGRFWHDRGMCRDLPKGTEVELCAGAAS